MLNLKLVTHLISNRLLEVEVCNKIKNYNCMNIFVYPNTMKCYYINPCISYFNNDSFENIYLLQKIGYGLS